MGKNEINEIDMKNRDNLNKEQAINSFRMDKAKKAKNIALAVTLGFIGLTAFSAVMFISSAFPPAIGGFATLFGAALSACGSVVYAKQNSKYKDCVCQKEYYNQVEVKIAQRKQRELQKQKELEKERLRKQQKEQKKSNKNLMKEGKIKVAKSGKKYVKLANVSGKPVKKGSNSTFTSNQKQENEAYQAIKRKNELIKDINSFLDSGK